jgi:hypothetical protein
MAHESFHRDEELRTGSDRTFGFVFTGAFVVLGVLPVAFGGSLRLWSLVAAAVFLAAALLAPASLAPLNRVWMRLGIVLNRIVNPIVLAIMFFGVVTPTGLLMRLFGRAPLRLRYEPDAPSYWVRRTPPGPPPQSLERQF